MMEPVGAVNIVQKIFEKTGTKITHYLSDGDSKAFSQVAKFCQHNGWEICKLECTNHVSKRVNTNLRKIRTLNSKVKLPGNSRVGLGGKGRLTTVAIEKIQNYYTWIIKNSGGDTKLMSKRIMAMYSHIASTDKEPQHENCELEYCKYLQAERDHQKYHHSSNFHIMPSVMEKVKDVFTKFANENFLLKCSHGKNQNANESFNSGVWNIVPKNGFANRGLIELGVAINVCIINEGYSAVMDVLRELYIPTSPEMYLRCDSLDLERTKKRKRQQSSSPPIRKKAKQNDENDGYERGMGD